MSLFEKYKGKKIEVEYETGYHYMIEYLGEKTLTWHALSKAAEGAKMDGTEDFDYYEIGDEMYDINWVEESGLVYPRSLILKMAKCMPL